MHFSISSFYGKAKILLITKHARVLDEIPRSHFVQLTCQTEAPYTHRVVRIYQRKILAGLNALVFLTLTIGILIGVAAQPAGALTIIRQYIPPGEPFEFDGLQVAAGKAPANTVGGGNLIEVFHAAADSWERVIRDNHTLTIQFGWSPIPIGGGVHNIRYQGGIPNRVMEAIVYFDNDGSTMWFLDPTPRKHSEFPTLVECYAGLGKGPINSGRVLSNGLQSGPTLDLLTIAKHEIGHALGLSTWNYQWVLKGAEKGIHLNAPRPFAGTVLPVDTKGHLRLHGALMDQSLLPGQRKLISMVDLLAISEMGEFTDLNFNFEHLPNGDLELENSKADSPCVPGL